MEIEKKKYSNLFINFFNIVITNATNSYQCYPGLDNFSYVPLLDIARIFSLSNFPHIHLSTRRLDLGRLIFSCRISGLGHIWSLSYSGQYISSGTTTNSLLYTLKTFVICKHLPQALNSQVDNVQQWPWHVSKECGAWNILQSHYHVCMSKLSFPTGLPSLGFTIPSTEMQRFHQSNPVTRWVLACSSWASMCFIRISAKTRSDASNGSTSCPLSTSNLPSL